MTVAQGYRSWAGIGVQTVLGTGVAPTTFFDFNSETLKEHNELIDSARLGSASMRIAVQGLRYTDGSINIDGNYEGLETFFKHTLGGVATTTPSGGTLSRLHTFALTDELPSPGITLAVNKGGLKEHWYQDCKFQSMRI